MPGFVISANRVHDGGVVYLDPDRRWTSRLAAAATYGAQDHEAAIAWARTQEALVCDPHAIKVRETPDGPAPLDAKQRIRAAGPEATLLALGFLPQATATALATASAPASAPATHPVHRAEVEV